MEPLQPDALYRRKSRGCEPGPPLSKQIVAGSSSTALAKGEVVLTGAALVTVTFDGYGQRRVAFQECSLTIERRLRIAVKHSAVIAEVYSVTNGSKLVLYAVNTPG